MFKKKKDWQVCDNTIILKNTPPQKIKRKKQNKNKTKPQQQKQEKS